MPADAFYEWRVVEGGKQPYAIARQDGQPMAFAGLWESFRWADDTVTRSFTIMTTTPNVKMHAGDPGPAGLADIARRDRVAGGSACWLAAEQCDRSCWKPSRGMPPERKAGLVSRPSGTKLRVMGSIGD